MESATAYDGGPFGRPLASLSFGLNHLVCGLEARCYKQVNLVIHLLNSLLLLKLVTLGLTHHSNSPTLQRTLLAATALSLVWAVHPLQVSSVLYVVQRMEILALTFTLAGLILYSKGRCQQQASSIGGWRYLVAGTAIASLGLASKETAVLFPLYTLCLELTLFRFKAVNPQSQRWIRGIYLVSFSAAFVLFLLIVLPHYARETAYSHRPFSLHERLLTQLRVLPTYLGMIVIPNPDSMAFYYDDVTPSVGLTRPMTTLWGGILLGSLALAAFSLRKTAPLASLGILLFFAAHFLTSNVFSLELVFEHRNYFALFGVVLTIYALFKPTLGKIAAGKGFTTALALALSVGLMSLTVVRSLTWGDPFNLAMHHAAVSPKSARAQTDLGTLYAAMADSNANSPFYRSAVQKLEQAARRDSASPLPEHVLIILAASSGVEAADAWWVSFNEKLGRMPIGAQERSAVQGLIRNRLNGLYISDDWLQASFEVLSERTDVPAQMFALFGFYALNSLSDQSFANGAFSRALAAAEQDRQQIQDWVDRLLSEGHVAQANRLISALQSSSSAN